jgi:RSC4 Ig-like domain
MLLATLPHWHLVTTLIVEAVKPSQLLVCLAMGCHHHLHLVFKTSIRREDMLSLSTINLSTSPQTRALIQNGDSLVKVSHLTLTLLNISLTKLAASDAMITNLSLATHPGLNISRHFRMVLPPSPTMAQQSITINLPSTHYYLQIKPTIAPSLLERQYKLFVTSGMQRLHAMPTIPGHSVDQQHPLFEARLLPGVNRIEVELIAALPKGSTKMVGSQEVELEKITVFANLMRS